MRVVKGLHKNRPITETLVRSVLNHSIWSKWNPNCAWNPTEGRANKPLDDFEVFSRNANGKQAASTRTTVTYKHRISKFGPNNIVLCHDAFASDMKPIFGEDGFGYGAVFYNLEESGLKVSVSD